MNVKYNFNGENYSYDVVNEKEEKDKVNFLLTNNKGDFVNLGVEKNVSKYQGMSICNPQNLEIFKILDEIILPGLDVKNVEYGGYYVKREYVSKLSQVVHVPVIPNEKSDFDDEAELNYDDNGVLEETYEDENEIVAEDKFYLGPSGGMIYEVFNYEGNLVFDLDIHKFNDFDEWGRNYNVYKKNGIVFVEYTKQKEDKEEYKVYFGIKSTNFVYDLLDDWVEKNYEYSKKRGSLSSRYVYRLMSIWVDQSKRLIIGSGFSEEEVFNQINLLEMHQGELEKLDNERFKDLVSNVHFREPIPQDFTIAYKLSVNGLYNFLNKGFETESVKSGSFAGYPWFSNVWARDELVGLRGFINLNDLSYVKEKIFDYLNKIDIDSGLIKRIDEEGALNSPDGVFWLAKRIEDFIYTLEKNRKLNDFMSNGDLELVYSKLYNSFEKIVENYWCKDIELLKVNYGDSWMDTIQVEYPLDIQVQFLELISCLVVLAQVLQKNELKELTEFEDLLRNKIKKEYHRNSYLYNEVNSDKINSNVFLAYYFYPGLFRLSEWDEIIDKTLPHLETSWGGISSLSYLDSEFKSNYTGENNLSYHRGDSWFWINNIVAIVLNDLNPSKYRTYISKIMMSSTKDILSYGCLGYGSEISSAEKQKSEGCFAQLWSVSTYIEMIDSVFKRE